MDSGSAPLMRWALRPGDVLALHSLSFHGGGGLSAALPERNSLVFRVFGDDAVFRAGMMGLQSGSACRECGGLFYDVLFISSVDLMQIAKGAYLEIVSSSKH